MRAVFHLQSDCLLVFFAGLACFVLVWFDAEASASSSGRSSTGWTRGFLLILEQLHQQVKLGITAKADLTYKPFGVCRNCYMRHL